MTDGPPPPLPNFLVIGSQRGGSTYLHRQLRAHPEVFMPPREEGYFDDPFYAARGEPWLRELFAGSEAYPARGFRESLWIARPECPERMARDLPGVRLLASLREPVSRSVSTYFHYIGLGLMPVRPLNEGMRILLDGGWVDRYPAASHVLEHSHYGPQLERVLTHHDRDHFLLLVNEEIRDDPPAALRASYEFVGVDPTFLPDNLTDATNAGTRRLGRLRVRRVANKFVFRSSHESPLGFTVKDSFVPRAFSAVVTRFEQRVMSKVLPERPHALDPALRAELEERFAPDVEAVEAHLARTIPSWHRT
jgi:hypothetical protein